MRDRGKPDAQMKITMALKNGLMRVFDLNGDGPAPEARL